MLMETRWYNDWRNKEGGIKYKSHIVDIYSNYKITKENRKEIYSNCSLRKHKWEGNNTKQNMLETKKGTDNPLES